MALIVSKSDLVNKRVINRMVDALWELPLDELSETDRLLFAVWTFSGFTGLEGIERAIIECRERSLDENYDWWAEFVKGLEFFDLKRLYFVKNGMDWILSQSRDRKDKMTRLLGWGFIYVNKRIFNKLVEVGAIDVNKIDRKAIHDSLVRDGLIDDPNVKRDPFDY